MKYWLLFFCNIFSLCVLAEEVPLSEARTWAQNFFQNQIGSRGNSVSLTLVWSGEDESSRSNSQPAFYVFNRNDQKGFVIVSGDDLVNPLIGYSFNHDFQLKDMPSHLRSWLMDRKKEINYIRKNVSAAPVGMNRFWNGSVSTVGHVLKKVETAQWNQGAPYNNKCPVDHLTGRTSVTGCVATAFAIALKAREWPDAGMGVVPAYEYEDAQGNKVSISEHLLGHNYNWDRMPLDNLTQSSDKEAIEEVSTLMADCGKMVKATYSSQATGAYVFDVAKALRNFLKYSPNLNYESREFYSTLSWNAMIQKEINENGPVIYGGVSSGAGHAFILDGYTDKNYYSVNWGWGGTANGYYTLSLLNPNSQGIGGSNSEDGFNVMQDAVFSMKKATPDEVIEKYPNFNIITFLYNEIQQYYYGLVPTTNQICQGEKFIIENFSFANLAYRGIFPLELAVSVYDKNHQYKETVSEVIPSDNLPEMFIELTGPVECLISGTIEEGDYLALGYRPKGCKEWKEMIGGHQTQYRIPLLGNNFASSQDILVLSSGDKYDDVYWGIKSSRKVIKKNQEFFLKTGSVCNTKFDPFKGMISAGLYDKEGVLKYRVTDSQVTIFPPLYPGQCAEYKIQSCKVNTDIVEGDYIALCYKMEGSEEWKRVPPLTGVTGRLVLEPQGEEPILEKETSFRYNKKDKVIKLSTIEDTAFDWQDVNGRSISSGTAINGVVSINVDKLDKGSYKLILKYGEQSKTIQVIL